VVVVVVTIIAVVAVVAVVVVVAVVAVVVVVAADVIVVTVGAAVLLLLQAQTLANLAYASARLYSPHHRNAPMLQEVFAGIESVRSSPHVRL
jgi:hypothetical protein